MTDFEIAKNVRSAALSRFGQVAAYHKSWGADFSLKEIVGLPAALSDRSDWFRPVDANSLSSAELDELGFGTWSDELPIRLIPIWLLPFLKNEIDAQSISGDPITNLSEADNDTRFGCLAYGVIPKS